MALTDPTRFDKSLDFETYQEVVEAARREFSRGFDPKYFRVVTVGGAVLVSMYDQAVTDQVYHRFRPSINSEDRLSIDIAIGSWIHDRVITHSTAVEALGNPAVAEDPGPPLVPAVAERAWIVATLNSLETPTTLTITDEESAPTGEELKTKRAIAFIDYNDAGTKIDFIFRHQLSDIFTGTIYETWWFKEDATGEVLDTDYLAQEDEPSSGEFALGTGAFWMSSLVKRWRLPDPTDGIPDQIQVLRNQQRCLPVRDP